MTEPTRTLRADVAPAASASVELLTLGDESVLIDENRCRVEVLNPTGAVVWRCLNGESTIGEIATDIAAAFTADIDVVMADIVDLVHQLARMGLVEIAGADANPERDGDSDGALLSRSADSCPDFDSRPESGAPTFLGVPPNP